MLEVLILGFTAVANLLLGLFVFVKNPKASTNRFFLLLTSSFVLWSIVNYFSVHPFGFSQLTWIRLVLFCGALLNLSVFLSFLAFPAANLNAHYRKWAKIALAATILIMPLTLTPLVFKELSFDSGKAQPVPNFGIALFMLHTVSLIGASFVIVIRKFLHADTRTKQQLKLVLLGIAGTFSLIVIANFLLVVLLNFTGLIPFGPAFTLIFSVSFAYAIIRHRLFDVRAAVARSLAYVLSLGFLGSVYGLLSFGLTSLLTSGGEVDTLQRALYVVFALLTALIYESTKNFFDRVTNRIFYRDAYDPQEFLDQLNKSIVSNIEIGILLRHTTAIIDENLKSEFCQIGIPETDKTPYRVTGTKEASYTASELSFVHDRLAEMGQEQISVEEIPSHEVELRKFFITHNIALIMRLTASYYGEEHDIAYLILGNKKSGNIYGKQDFRILDIIADELVIAIQNALRFEEIQDFNVTLQKKVNDATTRLKKTNEKLKSMDETKDEFISMASHQLRTPLTSVKGYLSMVLEGDAGDITETQRKLLDQAFVSSQRMVYLIADLLNVSRLRTGKFVIESHSTNLADVIEGEVSQLTEQAKLKKVELVYKKPKDFPQLMIDETKVRQVVMNFIDNSLYYTPSGGKVRVELDQDRGAIYFRVFDNGLGVPKEEQKHLFTKFYRAKNARKARPDGTGLGLFMAKKVITAQGGNIIFESEEGKGSTFGFCFSKKHLALPDKSPAS